MISTAFTRWNPFHWYIDTSSMESRRIRNFSCAGLQRVPPTQERRGIKEKIQWVQPKLVCEVEYAELTADDQLRQTTFLGWRDDKKARDVVLENTQTA